MAKKEDIKEVKKDTKNKKSFFKGLKAELKKVIWPSPKQLMTSTTAVIVIVIITAVIVFALDFVFNIFNIKVLDRAKEALINTTSVESTEENTSTENVTTDANVVDENTVVENSENTVVTENVVE